MFNANYSLLLTAHIHPIRKIYMRWLIQGTHHAFPLSVQRAQHTICAAVCARICMFMCTGKAITIYKWVPYTTPWMSECVVGPLLAGAAVKKYCRYDAIGAINKMRRHILYSLALYIFIYLIFSPHISTSFYRSLLEISAVAAVFLSLFMPFCTQILNWIHMCACILRGRENCVSSDNFQLHMSVYACNM